MKQDVLEQFGIYWSGISVNVFINNFGSCTEAQLSEVEAEHGLAHLSTWQPFVLEHSEEFSFLWLSIKP